MHNITFHFEDREVPNFNSEFFSLWLLEVAKSYSKNLGDLSYIFCSDDYLLEVNRSYLDHDYYTDIITFNYNDDGFIAGDLFLSVDRIKDNANDFEVEFENELARVMVHGVLHLFGFDDKTELDAKQMREEETKCLILLSKVSRETL